MLPKIIPALADLTQDIAGPLPVGLLQDWASGTQDLKSAGALLETFKIEGMVAASDGAGLSRLTEEKDLLEVLALLSTPKEILYALGVEIGGRPIGTWVADNTEMYFSGSVGADVVLGAMAEAQGRIAARLAVQVGICVHRGTFYELGGGLYGRDAEMVRNLAEYHARPAEILATQAAADLYGGAGKSGWQPRADLELLYPQAVFSVGTQARMPHLTASDTRYPHPYPPEFFTLLSHLRDHADAEGLKAQIYATYLRERVVVFLARQRASVESNSLAALLDYLVTNALMTTVITRMTASDDHLAGLGGGIAILTFGTAREALDFVRAVRDRFIVNGLEVKIGVDQGPVLLFPNTRRPSGIVGQPVNVASRISEDAGVVGMINITERVADQLPDLVSSDRFAVQVPGGVLTGITL